MRERRFLKREKKKGDGEDSVERKFTLYPIQSHTIHDEKIILSYYNWIICFNKILLSYVTPNISNELIVYSYAIVSFLSIPSNML